MPYNQLMPLYPQTWSSRFSVDVRISRTRLVRIRAMLDASRHPTGTVCRCSFGAMCTVPRERTWRLGDPCFSSPWFRGLFHLLQEIVLLSCPRIRNLIQQMIPSDIFLVLFESLFGVPMKWYQVSANVLEALAS